MKSKLDLHTVRILRAVAEHGSITAAAGALGYSQPALSQHLQRAEHRLGVPLLLRVGRTVRLTEAGRVVVRHAGPILAALAAADDELGQLADRATGTIRLAGFPSASSTIVPLLIARISRLHPGLRLVYSEAEPPEALALVADGAVDLALTFAYPGDPADPHSELGGIEIVPLFDDPSVVILPWNHPLSGSPDVPLGELAEDAWIGGCPLCRGHLLAACSALGFSPRITHATDNSVAVLGLVAAGVGVALQPELALEPLELPSGTSAHRLSQASDRQVRAVHLTGAQAIPAVATTLSALREITAGRRQA